MASRSLWGKLPKRQYGAIVLTPPFGGSYSEKDELPEYFYADGATERLDPYNVARLDVRQFAKKDALVALVTPAHNLATSFTPKRGPASRSRIGRTCPCESP